MNPSEVRILVVDDDHELRETVVELFTKFQFKVDSASSGNQAWELVKKNKYNIVLTDVRMADGDGVELAKNIRAQHPSSPSILFISGFSQLMNEEIFHVGAEGKFSKPFDINSIKNAIKTCLLSTADKWSQPSPKGRIPFIEKKGKDFLELESQKSVIFGRGGFFVSHSFAAPSIGSSVVFSISVSDPVPIVFKGAGIIQWVQARGKNGIPAGLGVEITTLESVQIPIYLSHFEKVVAYIPSINKKVQEEMIASAKLQMDSVNKKSG